MTVLTPEEQGLIASSLRVASRRFQRSATSVPLNLAPEIMKQAIDAVALAERFDKAASVTLDEVSDGKRLSPPAVALIGRACRA